MINMGKTSSKTFAAVLLLLLTIILCAVYSIGLNRELVQKDAKIDELTNLNTELQNQLEKQQKSYLVTSLGFQ